MRDSMRTIRKLRHLICIVCAVSIFAGFLTACGVEQTRGGQGTSGTLPEITTGLPIGVDSATAPQTNVPQPTTDTRRTTVRPQTDLPQTTEATIVTPVTTGTTTANSENTTSSDGQTTASKPETTLPPLQDADFVRAGDYIPDLIVDLKYATTDNFTGQVIYDFSDAYLRYGTVRKLAAVADVLRAQGYRIKIWDAYRPIEAQWKLWEVCPDPTYVADPRKGYSSHSRGNTVDITLCRADGSEVTMPTGFDDFTKKADRNYSDCSEEESANALLLENAMIAGGFKPYSGEWWHFSDTTVYDVAE